MEVFDNVFSIVEHSVIFDMCKKIRTYKYGEHDGPGTPVSGMAAELEPSDEIPSIIIEKIYELKPELKNMNLVRMYINCFAPSEDPYFHRDSQTQTGITSIYYPHLCWEDNDCGETQILKPGDDFIYGVKPRPNRMVIFNGYLEHKATSFRSEHRFTIVTKYEK